jgi:signal transduction histidine kinase
MKRAPLRRALHVLIWLTALAAPLAALSYFFYADLLNPRSIQLVAEPYDRFYRDAAQFQIAYMGLENQVLLYKAGLDADTRNAKLRYQILQSKLHVMSASTSLLSKEPKLARLQQDELTELNKTIDAVGRDLDALPSDPARAVQIVAGLRERWGTVNDLAQSWRLVDIADRDALKQHFIAKRRFLFVAVLLLSAAATVLLVRTGVRRTKLIGQQNAALAAEHEATRTAREASLAKVAFLGMISHELRTPLHAIVSSIELLGFKFQTDADRKVIRRLETAARHLEAQMRDLTDYARLGAGKLLLHDERFDPRALIESIVDEHTQAASAKGLTLVGDAGDSKGLIESDPHRIRQIVSNLVTNAIKYTDAGTVRVQLARVPDALAISVGDTGPGVAQAQIPLLFKEFTQLAASRTRRFDGAGLGLTIVQELVELFGGTIGVSSRVGEGTTFTVTIPVKAVAVAQESGAARDLIRD